MFGVLGVIGDDIRMFSGSCRASHDGSDSPPSIDRELQNHTKVHFRPSCPHQSLHLCLEAEKVFLIREDVQKTDL